MKHDIKLIIVLTQALESDMSHYPNGMLEDAVLPHVIRFMRPLPHYLSAVAHCARKTEMMQWEYLFQSTGVVTVSLFNSTDNDQISLRKCPYLNIS